MQNSISNSAEITILSLIDNTFSTGGGPYSIGATVLRASKGPVGEVVQVTDANRETIFGKPLPNHVGQHMEGLRHLADACQDCAYINVVRVVAADAKYPSLSLIAIVDKGAWSDAAVTYAVNDVVTIAGDAKLICLVGHTTVEGDTEPTAASENWAAFTNPIEQDAHAYGTALSIATGYILQVFPVDGDPSANRSFSLASILTNKGVWVTETAYNVNDLVSIADGTQIVCAIAHTSGATQPTVAALTSSWKVLSPEHKRFTINFYDKDDLEQEYVLETYTVGILSTDRDDMGRPAYIESVLEEQSTRFRCNYNPDVTWSELQDSLDAAIKTSFAGGTNGGEPTSENYRTAWDIFRDENIPAYLMFAAGNYDETVLSNCIDIADKRHVSFFFDVSPLLSPSAAKTWQQQTGLESRQAAAYYCPYSANDAWYGGKTVWGCSGDVVAACARGDAIFTGEIPGVHHSPAGINRGKLSRTGLKNLYPGSTVSRLDLYRYNVRINPIVIVGGKAYIDDALSLHYKENYSRFVWVNRIANYIDYRFLEMAGQIKHEPDGMTRSRLERGMKDILGGLVTSGALSSPRDPDYDGNAAYTVTITQEALDFWLVEWAFCPTGSARRIAGQPKLIK